MRQLAGVRFKDVGRSTYIETNGLTFDAGEQVIVDFGFGEEVATISIPLLDIEDDKVPENVYSVIRKLNAEDKETIKQNDQDEKEAYSICQERIHARNLEMKLIKSEYTFSRNKLIFYFTADGRVDFRELVKDLAGIFHTRIELRQIGVRDETKLLGGIGICGRAFCCNTFLTEFAPVSIKMAKEQRLSLNPNKISGVCGRLMCCLTNEEETYEYLNSQLPSRGETVKTSDGREGTVYAVNVLKQLVTVLFEVEDEKETVEYPAEDIVKRFRRRRRDNQDGEESLSEVGGEDSYE